MLIFPNVLLLIGSSSCSEHKSQIVKRQLVNPCRTTTCSNNGVCVWLLAPTIYNLAVCLCPTGYVGATCQFYIGQSTIQTVCVGSNACQNGGTCQQLSSNTAQCVCPTGFTGTYCQIANTLCAGVTCRNGGYCQAVGALGAVCQCPNGWGGVFCHIANIYLQCSNGGVSGIYNGQSYCYCPNGYSGTNCQYGGSGVTTTATPTGCVGGVQCINGGTCYTQSNGVSFCNCPSPYTGYYCQSISTTTTATITTVSLSCSNGLQCQNGGVCQTVSGISFCNCPSGYTGPMCQYSNSISTTIAPTPCLLLNCQNGGTCLALGGPAFCYCMMGFNGPLCQFQMGATTMGTTTTASSGCSANGIVGCQNSGTCIGSGSSAYCYCTNGFTGPVCQFGTSTQSMTTTTTTPSGPTSSCSGIVCYNGATCFLNGNNPFCYCVSGYGGANCQYTVSNTTLSPTCASLAYSGCQNSGTCINIGAVNFCSCLPGFYGSNCQFGSATTTVPPATTPSSSTTSPLYRCSNSDANLCSSNGKCFYNTTSVFCKCFPTYSPPLCTSRASYCSTVTCQNGGTCYNTGEYTGICVCPTSSTVTYSGTYCEFQSQCTGYNPCQNGNQCAVINGLPYCFCTSQYTGVYCEAFLPKTG